ncbi:MAG: DUF6089 family protein [Ginsengibacter sp.]
MKNYFLSTFLLLFVSGVSAQNLHLNLFTGISNYQGDLQDKKFTFSQSHLAGGLGITYDVSPHLALRTGVMIGKISGDDQYGRNKVRNLNFSTLITEANLGLEYYITAPVEKHSLTPYVFAEVAIYHYNPYTFDSTGRKYYLRPLSTEGEGIVQGRNNYNLTQFSIPFGAGVKLSLSDNVNVGFEFGFRKLFTDYLDDVSTSYIDKNILLSARGAKAMELSYRGDELKNGNQQYPTVGAKRGNPNSDDWYYFSGLTISFRLGGGGLGRYASQRCPGNVL